MATINETIPSLGDVPTTADPATFDARADTLLGTALPAFRTAVNVWAGEANALGADVTTKSETATTASATAVSAKDAAVAAANYVGEWSAQSGAATVPTAVSNNDLVYGLKVDVADITAVEPGVTSGWESTWLVVFEPAGAGDHKIIVHTGNGYGSTNTMIRRFTTTLSSVGTAITYADSAANGASFTINENGIYSIEYTDTNSSGDNIPGISLNSSQLTTSIISITAADRIAINQGLNNRRCQVTVVVKLSSGDVIRPHNLGAVTSPPEEGISKNLFTIKKIGA